MLEFGPGKPSWKNLVRRFLMHQVPVLKPDNGHVVHAIAAKFPKSQVNAFDRCPHILEVSDDHDDALDAMATQARDDVTDHKRQSVVATVRERFGIPRSTLFRLAARLRKTQRASGLRPMKRGTHEGALTLALRTERIIAEQVDRFWLKKEKTSLAALLRRIRAVCLTEGMSPPHRSTVQMSIGVEP
jgi:hypothetical protein